MGLKQLAEGESALSRSYTSLRGLQTSLPTTVISSFLEKKKKLQFGGLDSTVNFRRDHKSHINFNVKVTLPYFGPCHFVVLVQSLVVHLKS